MDREVVSLSLSWFTSMPISCFLSSFLPYREGGWITFQDRMKKKESHHERIEVRSQSVWNWKAGKRKNLMEKEREKESRKEIEKGRKKRMESKSLKRGFNTQFHSLANTMSHSHLLFYSIISFLHCPSFFLSFSLLLRGRFSLFFE